MNEEWETLPASSVKPGDRVRVAGDELTVTRIDARFLGRPERIAFIEDTAERWYKRPVGVDAEVHVQVSA
jgi:hypothetical protein